MAKFMNLFAIRVLMSSRWCLLVSAEVAAPAGPRSFSLFKLVEKVLSNFKK